MAKILIIDDSSMARRSLSTILSRLGHEVIEAADGISGLEKFYLENPDLVTLDLTMEGLTGMEVLKNILEVNPAAKVLIATADIQSFTKSMVREAGARGIVNKPFSEESVSEAVNKLLTGGESWT